MAGCEVLFLRQAGLSGRKAEYIKGLAERFVGGELSARMLVEAPYEEVLEQLLAVRGLGRWSVEMFACFGLKRMDVFSVGDLGVQYVSCSFTPRFRFLLMLLSRFPLCCFSISIAWFSVVLGSFLLLRCSYFWGCDTLMGLSMREKREG